MMNKIYKHLLAASLLMMGGTAMAQTLNSAYFTDDYKFRHDMNPAFENKQNYITIPALGNINVNLQGNFGYQDIVLNNPMYGQEAGAKKMTSFMNPYISVDEALKGFSKSNNRIQGDVHWIPQEREDVHNVDPSMALRDRKQALPCLMSCLNLPRIRAIRIMRLVM